MTATANVVHSATDLKRVGQRDQNEVTGTKHAAQVEAARKHHQNPAVLIEAMKKANAPLPRIVDIEKRDRRLVKVAQVADDQAWIAVQDTVPLQLRSEAPAVGDPILMLTHVKMAQVIADRVSAPIINITDRSSACTAANSVTAGLTLDTVPAGMAVIIPDSTHDMVQCTIADSGHKAIITDRSSAHTAASSDTAGPTLDITLVDTVATIPDSIHDMVRCIITDSAHKAAITDRSSAHIAATSDTAGLTLDITPVDTVVATPVSTHAMVRCTITDLAHKAVITNRSSVHTAAHSDTAGLTLDIMPVDTVVTTLDSTHDMVQHIVTDSAHNELITVPSPVRIVVSSAAADPILDITPVATAIISVPILVHNMVARCMDIISVHEMATVAHISAHAG
ncbi:MAG TPA: hypothetical protein VGM98_09315 [Schlesneria sp.]